MYFPGKTRRHYEVIEKMKRYVSGYSRALMFVPTRALREALSEARFSGSNPFEKRGRTYYFTGSHEKVTRENLLEYIKYQTPEDIDEYVNYMKRLGVYR